MASPPSQSWSAARGLFLGDATGPRPVRRLSAPWGVPDLTFDSKSASRSRPQI